MQYLPIFIQISVPEQHFVENIFPRSLDYFVSERQYTLHLNIVTFLYTTTLYDLATTFILHEATFATKCFIEHQTHNS